MNELIGQLVSQLGVREDQAKGGAGLLLKLAQGKLGGDFGKVAQAIPDAQDLISAAPAAGGASKLLGGLSGALGGKAGDLASLAAAFGQLKLDPSMIGKFVPVILSFVQSKGGQEVVTLLAGVLGK
jgi:hypothetical protein